MTPGHAQYSDPQDTCRQGHAFVKVENKPKLCSRCQCLFSSLLGLMSASVPQHYEAAVSAPHCELGVSGHSVASWQKTILLGLFEAGKRGWIINVQMAATSTFVPSVFPSRQRLARMQRFFE